MHEDVVRMRQNDVRTASGWRQNGVSMASGMVHICVRKPQGGVKMAWDDIRVTSGKCQESVRVVSGWRQETSEWSNRVRNMS